MTYETSAAVASAAVSHIRPIHQQLEPDYSAWPDPEPLAETQVTVPEFNLNLLPDAIRPWISDVAERLQCPPDYPAVGAMVALSSLIGRQVSIRPKQRDDWTVIGNLWGAITGRPGIFKTPALHEALRPIRRLEAEAHHDYEIELKAHELKAYERKAQLKNLERQLAAASKDKKDTSQILAEIRDLKDDDQPPTCVRYETSDSTVEKLGELLVENPLGILLFRDEITGWLRTLDRKGMEGARQFYLEAWSGYGVFSFDRIVRGTTFIDGACVSVLGGIQPGPLSDYVHQALKAGGGSDGLLQRFQLLVWPDEPDTWRNVDRWPDSKARQDYFGVFKQLAEIDTDALQADPDGDVPFLRFDGEGQEIFDEWRLELETERVRGAGSEALESHLFKYRSLMPSLALIHHLVNGGTGPVAKDSAMQGVFWCEYLEEHARRVYQIAANDDQAVKSLMQHIKAGDLKNSFKPRDVYRKCWTHLNDAQITLDAIEVLESLNWLRAEECNGERKNTFFINPKINPRKKL